MKISGVRTVYAAIVLCGILYAFVSLRGPNGIQALVEKRHQVDAMERGNLKLTRELEEKQERIKRLQENPAEQEFEIRERLKMAKPGEKVFILDPASSQTR